MQDERRSPPTSPLVVNELRGKGSFIPPELDSSLALSCQAHDTLHSPKNSFEVVSDLMILRNKLLSV